MRRQEKIPFGDEIGFGQEEKLPFFATQAGKTVSALLMVVILIVILALQLGSGGSIAYEMDDTQLAVACMDRKPVFIPFDSITDVELVETFSMDRTIEAAPWDSGWCGTYENEEYGTFTLYAYSGSGIYIVVKHKDGVLIFNDKSRKTTEKAYKALLKGVDMLGGKNSDLKEAILQIDGRTGGEQLYHHEPLWRVCNAA